MKDKRKKKSEIAIGETHVGAEQAEETVQHQQLEGQQSAEVGEDNADATDQKSGEIKQALNLIDQIIKGQGGNAEEILRLYKRHVQIRGPRPTLRNVVRTIQGHGIRVPPEQLKQVMEACRFWLDFNTKLEVAVKLAQAEKAKKEQERAIAEAKARLSELAPA